MKAVAFDILGEIISSIIIPGTVLVIRYEKDLKPPGCFCRQNQFHR